MFRIRSETDRIRIPVLKKAGSGSRILDPDLSKGPVITIEMLELMWVFTTVERVNFTPNWLRTILFVYDF